MKNTIRKQPLAKSNVLSLVDNRKFKTKTANDNLYFYTASYDRFGFRCGDQIICRDYVGEQLSPNAIVIAATADFDKTLTTVSNAVNIHSVVVAFRREISNG